MKTILVRRALSCIALLMYCVFTASTIQAAEKPRMTAPKVLERIQRVESGVIVYEVQRDDRITWATEKSLGKTDIILRTFETVKPRNQKLNPYLQDKRPSKWGLSCEEDFEPPLDAIIARFSSFIDKKGVLRLMRLELDGGRIYWEPFEVFMQRETTCCQQSYNQACCPWYKYGCFGMPCTTDLDENDLLQPEYDCAPYRKYAFYAIDMKKRKYDIYDRLPSDIFRKQLYSDMSGCCVCGWSTILTLIEDNFSRIAESLWS